MPKTCTTQATHAPAIQNVMWQLLVSLLVWVGPAPGGHPGSSGESGWAGTTIIITCYRQQTNISKNHLSEMTGARMSYYPPET